LKWDIAFRDGDKTLVAVDHECKVRWWDVATGKTIREWDAMQGVAKPNDPGTWKFYGAYGTTLTRDGRILAAFAEWKSDKTGQEENKCRRRLIVWDLDRRKQRWHLERTKEDSFVFDLSADGKVAAVGIGKAGLSIRDGIKGRELRRIEHPAKGAPDYWESLALTTDGKMLAALGEGSTGVCVWDTGSSKVLHQLSRNVRAIPQRFRSSSGQPIIFSPDGKTLAFPLEDTLALWDVASWTERPRREGHREPILFLSFSADGQTLVSGGEGAWPHASYPYTAVHWSTATWRETARFERSDE
jgi:WD40 repeat protein